ncbi:MAG: hypothetical protein ACLSH8_15215 [Zhenhengia sp.]|uniref:hypothetical protein n=1 Tax=Zhenhengia sp. TaxID=2944208 RepID=UPI00290ADAD3|nr:hypothetical protein [Clostridiales bacterium]MDU6974304.1 hypothetical protein [Clostridiales bacterium]
MEQEEIKIDLSKIDFNEDRSYGFLKVEDKEEKNKKYKLLLKEAISRGEEKLLYNFIGCNIMNKFRCKRLC